MQAKQSKSQKELLFKCSSTKVVFFQLLHLFGNKECNKECKWNQMDHLTFESESRAQEDRSGLGRSKWPTLGCGGCFKTKSVSQSFEPPE